MNLLQEKKKSFLTLARLVRKQRKEKLTVEWKKCLTQNGCVKNEKGENKMKEEACSSL